MEVKTAELKAKLSSYLRSVREDGASYVVLDRKTPVARLVPLAEAETKQQEDREWEELCEQMEKAGFKMTQARSRKDGRAPKPTVAPDGRTDINTVEEMRKEKDY